ncbi:MAG: hypothetical protein Q8L07_04130 [Sediminibacterium sp.]|nr:hypothetical protein [Sediminibacterium sp.]
MPKRLIHVNEKLSSVHPFRKRYVLIQRNIAIMRLHIMKRCNWSEATFYRKLNKDIPLKKREAKVICAVMNIPLTEIEKFQKGFSK